eukprot:6798289-Prymnesium_polylepis.1
MNHRCRRSGRAGRLGGVGTGSRVARAPALGGRLGLLPRIAPGREDGVGRGFRWSLSRMCEYAQVLSAPASHVLRSADGHEVCVAGWLGWLRAMAAWPAT